MLAITAILSATKLNLKKHTTTVRIRNLHVLSDYILGYEVKTYHRASNAQ